MGFINKKKETSYGIIGLGRFGTGLALELIHAGADVLVLDCDEEKVRALREYTQTAYIVDVSEKNSLLESGIKSCDVVVLCIGNSIETSILTTLQLVGLGIKKVIAKARSAEHGEILEKLGAEVVYPERDMALRLAHSLEADSTFDYIRLSEKLNIAKRSAPKTFIGKTLRAVDLFHRYQTNIIAIENGHTLLQTVPQSHVFAEGDILYLCGTREGLNRLEELD